MTDYVNDEDRHQADIEDAPILVYWAVVSERNVVVVYSDYGRSSLLEEQPIRPTSRCTAISLYSHDAQASNVARTLKPSPGGELEIADLNKPYLQRGPFEMLSHQTHLLMYGVRQRISLGLIQAFIFIYSESDHVLGARVLWRMSDSMPFAR